MPLLPTQRTFATTPAALQKAEAPSTQAQQSADAPLLHITKSKLGHKPSNPNARPPPPSHGSITRRLGVRFSRPVPGAQEWKTSTYSYNKATVKTLPTAAQTANDLITHYSVLRDNDGVPSSRTAIAGRRKSAEKVYVSKAGIKDFGNKIRIDAYMFDEEAAQAKLRAKTWAAKEAKRAARTRAPGGHAPGPQ